MNAPDNAGIESPPRRDETHRHESPDLPRLAIDAQDAESLGCSSAEPLLVQAFRGSGTDASDGALSIDPRHVAATRIGIRSRVNGCDWHSAQRDKRRISEGLRTAFTLRCPSIIGPYATPKRKASMVARLVAKSIPRPEQALWRGEKYRHDRIRVAYLSAGVPRPSDDIHDGRRLRASRQDALRHHGDFVWFPRSRRNAPAHQRRLRSLRRCP